MSGGFTLSGGEPLMLPPMESKERDDYLQAWTDEIMCRIAALLPRHYRGVYTNHPRLQELLQEQQPASWPKAPPCSSVF